MPVESSGLALTKSANTLQDTGEAPQAHEGGNMFSGFQYFTLAVIAVAIFAFCVWYYMSRTSQRSLTSAVLASEDWPTIIPKLRKLIDPKCRLLPTLREASTLDDEEYFGFFHHLFIPFLEEIRKRNPLQTSKSLDIDLLRRIDEKMLELNGGIEPPPYKTSLAIVLLEHDAFLRRTWFRIPYA